MTPLVSVVLAARDEEARIGRAVESILRQTLAEWELVVVDDGSTDATVDVAESYADGRIRILRRAPRGLAAALNTGIDHVSSSVVARLDADDEACPRRLERQLVFLQSNPEVTVLGSAWIECGSDGREVNPRVPFVPGRVNETLTDFNPLTHSSVAFRRAAVTAIGGYDETIRFAQDYDLWLRLAHEGHVLWNLDERLAVRHLTGENVAARKERAQVRAELTVRWRDLRRRRSAGRPVAAAARRLALRAVVLLAPLSLKRIARAARGRA